MRLEHTIRKDGYREEVIRFPCGLYLVCRLRRRMLSDNSDYLLLHMDDSLLHFFTLTTSVL